MAIPFVFSLHLAMFWHCIALPDISKLPLFNRPALRPGASWVGLSRRADGGKNLGLAFNVRRFSELDQGIVIGLLLPEIGDC